MHKRSPKPNLNCRAGLAAHLRNPNAKHARGFPTAACCEIVFPPLLFVGALFYTCLFTALNNSSNLVRVSSLKLAGGFEAKYEETR